MVRTAAAWIAIHGSRNALIEMVVTGLASVLASGWAIDRLGPFLFPSPLVGLLIVPVLSGIAVGTAAHADINLRLPDPIRARFARLLWSAFWITLAVVAVLAGLVFGDRNQQLGIALVRNTLLSVGLSLPLATEGAPHLLWIPSVVLVLSAAVFGRSEVDDSWFWWAVMFDPLPSRSQLLAAAFMAFVAIAHYVLRTRQGSTV